MKFRGEFAFLSNFYPAEVKMYGQPYPTVEHAFQAAKTLNRVERMVISSANTPGIAKRMGRKVTLRPDWEEVKLGFMEELVRRKFTHHPELKKKLLSTYNIQLVENNHWNDTFWGVCNGRGKNHLGKILMKIRTELREGEKK